MRADEPADELCRHPVRRLAKQPAASSAKATPNVDLVRRVTKWLSCEPTGAEEDGRIMSGTFVSDHELEEC